MMTIAVPWAGRSDVLWKGRLRDAGAVVRLPSFGACPRLSAMIGQRFAAALGYWPTLLGMVGALGIGGMLRSWLDYRRSMRKQTDDMATAIVHQLSARVKAVEDSAAQERASFTSRVAAVEDSAAQERLLCEAQLSVLRHRVNNLAGSFDGLLLLIEMAPDKAADFVARIKEQRAAQEIAEAAEKAAVLRARFEATGGASKALPSDPGD